MDFNHLEHELKDKESIPELLKQIKIHIPLFIIALSILAYLFGSTETFVSYFYIDYTI